MPPVRLAVAGAGVIGRAHLDLIHASSECELAAIVDPSAAAAAVADQHHVPLFASLEALFATDLPDGVILATPNALHVPQALACLAAGVPALVEKPLAHTLAEGERLFAASQVSSTPLLVGHHRAHSPILEQARRVISDGALGHLVAVMGSALFYKPDDYFTAAPWRTAPGGGPILLNLIHEIGNLRSLCGEIVEVQAMASHHTRQFEVEDTTAILLRFAGGALGTFLLSDTAASPRSWEQTSEENKAYSHYGDEDCYVISGTLGQLSVPTMRLKRFGEAQERSWFSPLICEQLPQERDDPLARQLAHFCAVIRGEAAPLVSVGDGLQNLRVVEAISEACRTGGLITLQQY